MEVGQDQLAAALGGSLQENPLSFAPSSVMSSTNRKRSAFQRTALFRSQSPAGSSSVPQSASELLRITRISGMGAREQNREVTCCVRCLQSARRRRIHRIPQKRGPSSPENLSGNPNSLLHAMIRSRSRSEIETKNQGSARF